MQTVPVKTYFLEMRRPTTILFPPPRADVRVNRLLRPDPADYLNIYERVGKAWRWVDRKLLPTAELVAIIHDPQVEIYVLTVAGERAGFVELDRRKPQEVEISYLGIMPAFIGRGLGRYLLNWAIHRAWAARPQRVWVHTCEWDHPEALSYYQKAGFQIYEDRLIDQAVLEE